MNNYDKALYDVLFALGELHEEHQMMDDTEDTLRGIKEARNKVESVIEDNRKF